MTSCRSWEGGVNLLVAFRSIIGGLYKNEVCEAACRSLTSGLIDFLSSGPICFPSFPALSNFTEDGKAAGCLPQSVKEGIVGFTRLFLILEREAESEKVVSVSFWVATLYKCGIVHYTFNTKPYKSRETSVWDDTFVDPSILYRPIRVGLSSKFCLCLQSPRGIELFHHDLHKLNTVRSPNRFVFQKVRQFLFVSRRIRLRHLSFGVAKYLEQITPIPV